MALQYMDGFDLYASKADVCRGGWRADAASQTFSTTGGRFGGGCLRNANATLGWAHPWIIPQGSVGYACFAYYVDNLAAVTGDVSICQARTRLGNILGSLRHDSTGVCQYYNNAGVQVGPDSAVVISNASWHWIEFKITPGTDATSGTIEARVNGVVVITEQTGIDTFQSASAAGIDHIFLIGAEEGASFDDIHLMDATGTTMNGYLGDTRITTLTPNSDGSTTNWTASAGADYQCVDDTPNAANDDTDYISSSTAAQVTQLQMSNFSDNPTSVNCVQVRARSKKTNAGDRTHRLNIISNAVKGNGNTLGLTHDYAWRRNGIFPRNPDGTIPWTKAAVDALQVEVELIA